MRRGRAYIMTPGDDFLAPKEYWVRLDQPARFCTYELPAGSKDRGLVWRDWWAARAVGTPLFCKLFNLRYEADPV